MDVLWAPWRMDYILGPKPDYCILCLPQHTQEDAARLVLYRSKHAFVIMNKFPYNNGHLMVAPLRHIPDITCLNPEENADMMQLMQQCVIILQKTMQPQGFNMGINMGEAAGAGVRDHLHMHVVPRWNGDASFITVCGETRSIPEHIETSYAKLLPHFSELKK